MKPKILNGIILSIGVLLWFLLLTFHILEQIAAIFPDNAEMMLVGGFRYRLSMVAFLLTFSIYLSRVFSNIEKLQVTTLLWRLFMIGMIGITVIMFITIGNRFTAQMVIYKYLAPVYFGMAFTAMMVFFISAVFIYRRFILYPRTRRKIFGWRVFLIFLAIGLILSLKLEQLDLGVYIFILYIPFAVLTLILSANVRWISYLNFNQKLRALGLFVLIMIVMITYLIAARKLPGILQIDFDEFLYIEFIYFVIAFPIVYTAFSILVLFFNLPTSSIFELKSFEIASFSKINQAIQSNLDFTDILNTLLDASIVAANAKAGWIEMYSEETREQEVKICKKITNAETQEIRSHFNITEKIIQDQKHILIKNIRKHKALRNAQVSFKCILAIPIMSNKETYGVVYVANDLVNSFEDVTIQSLITFAEQAGIALENARLVNNSIELERYQEQLKIAKEVQKELLPHNLPFSEKIEFVAMSETAQEVGGDYFDVVQPKDHLYRVAIGDVSGKGTTAAFYMAETKGIFRALARLDLSVSDFIITANQALSECMQKGFFVTLTYLEINTDKREIQLIRAGHSPSIYFDSKKDEIKELKEGGLGLAIVRNDGFKKFVKPSEKIIYNPGDVLVLYTDGIVEAKNQDNEEYGYGRLKQIVEKNKTASAAEIASGIVNSVKDFTHADLNDDYTVLIIRLR